MANKPSYKQARDMRKSATGSMTIESADPNVKIIDMTKTPPHTESLVKPDRPGELHTPKIVPTEPVSGMHAESGVVHEGDYKRPNYTGTTTT